MEVIIVIAVLVGVALWWSNRVKTEKSNNDNSIDTWEPPKELVSKEKEWPFGEKLPEGKIHVKVADVASVSQLKGAWIEATAPTGSENRVEAPAPVVTDSNPADNVPVVETKKAPAKKPAAKKTAAKPAAAKKTPAKKKSV